MTRMSFILAGLFALGVTCWLSRLRRKQDQYRPENWVHNQARKAWSPLLVDVSEVAAEREQQLRRAINREGDAA